MKSIKSYGKNEWLFAAFILIWLAPVLKTFTAMPQGQPLNNVEADVPWVPFNFTNWHQEAFQIGLESYLKQYEGFHHDLVRIHCQWEFSLFNKAKANSLIIGKENYLFESNYIRAALGIDYRGIKYFQNKAAKLKAIRKKLQSEGRDLLVVLAPGKGSFYPEFIPDRYKEQANEVNNYEAAKLSLNQYQIPLLDFNAWFKMHKADARYPLYPKCGLHWSKSSETFVADSLIKYVSQFTGVKAARIVTDSFKVKKWNYDGDYDAGDGMNLIWRIPVYPMAYPYFHYEDTVYHGPKVMVVADSYYWGLYNLRVSRSAFDHGAFWYYNEEINIPEQPGIQKVHDIDLLSEVRKNKLIIVLCTDANLYRFGFGFIENLYDAYFQKNPIQSSVKKIRYAFLQNKIRHDSKRMVFMVQRSAESGVSVDDLVKAEAAYFLAQEQEH